jgi:pilus assembly protein CpaF
MMSVLEQVLQRPGVSDVVINGALGMWVDWGEGLIREPGWAASEPEVRAIARELVARGGRHLDEAHPCVDVRAGAGIRVHAVLPPVSTVGTLISIRVAGLQQRSLEDLAAAGMMTQDQLGQLAGVVTRGETLLICGAAGSGKTTLLGAALAGVPPTHRLVVLEDVAELAIAHPHVVYLETRQANIEGAGAVGMSELVRQALRMRPDRLVLGECRGAELGEFLAALNTGHGGGGTTLHANSLADVPRRLEALGMLAGLAPEVLARQAVSAFDAVVFLERGASGRRIAGIGHVSLGPGGVLECATT